MQYQVHVRSQHARGKWPHQGPDTYVAVTIAPDGVTVPYPLNASLLAKRKIQIIYFGEGYRKHDGPKSMLGQAMESAHRFIDEKAKK